MRTESNPSFAELAGQLGQTYRHLQQEHQRQSPLGARRRTLESKMQQVAGRFERKLEQWVPNEELRAAWRRCFYEGGDAPGTPASIAPPLFVGISEAGSRVEIRPAGNGAYNIMVDGVMESHESIPWHVEPDMIEPMQVGNHRCREVTDAPPEALRALRDFHAQPGTRPPWRWAEALFEDGLIDENFALTARGQRISSRGDNVTATPSPMTFGILVADAARARVFVLHTAHGEHASTLSQLVEVSQLTRPDQRAPDRDVFASTRPGLRRNGGAPMLHVVGDRRDGHRQETDVRFSAEVADEAMEAFEKHRANRLIVVASPAMLGALRSALVRRNRGQRRWTVDELTRDLTWLTPPMLHDALGSAGLVPHRGRKPSMIPAPGLPM